MEQVFLLSRLSVTAHRPAPRLRAVIIIVVGVTKTHNYHFSICKVIQFSTSCKLFAKKSMNLSPVQLKSEFLAPIEVQDTGLIQIFVTRLSQIGCGLYPAALGLVELSDAGHTALIFGFSYLE